MGEVKKISCLFVIVSVAMSTSLMLLKLLGFFDASWLMTVTPFLVALLMIAGTAALYALLSKWEEWKDRE